MVVVVEVIESHKVLDLFEVITNMTLCCDMKGIKYDFKVLSKTTGRICH